MISVLDITAIISQVLPEPHAGLLGGILFGTKSALSAEFKNALQITGTLHIVALSGMNITILVGIFFSTFIVALPRWISSILTVGVIAIFVWFVGPSPSIVRAAIMGCITLLAPLTGRASVALVAWTIASVGMIIVNPAWIGELSYQLSVLASLGMILFGKQTMNRHTWHILYSETAEKQYHYLYRWYIHVRRIIQIELITTLSAQVFTIPLIFFTFGRISLISPLANLLIGWTIPISTVLGLLLSVVGKIWLPLSYPIAWVTWVFLEILIRAVVITSHIPFASIGR
ncbi:MAG: ComEC/Rec2 family competence protein [Candidatus Gottesmanbacteria bacterium]